MTQIKQNNAANSEVIPAIEVSLTGQHLIEASAGTGKTWTLTGIMLRLLIEARRSPEQIIATTFTRAAAAEMRQRIHDRLVDFYQILQWVEAISASIENKPHLFPEVLQVIPESQAGKTSNHQNKEASDVELNQDLDHDLQNQAQAKRLAQQSAMQSRKQWLILQAKAVGLDSVMEDPINMHLVSFLLDHISTYSLNEAIRRTALVLTTLDKLFVGTLDSLAQKWLAEYSSETGHQQGMAIIEDASIEQVTDSIIHDKLRQFQSTLYHQQPKLYDLMQQKGKLTSVGEHKKYVSRSLNFISAPIDEVPLDQNFDFENYERRLQQFAQAELTDIGPYLEPDYRKSQGFNGRSGLFTRFDSIITVHQKIVQHKINFESYLTEDEKKFIKALSEAQYPDAEGKIKHFNKNKEKQHQAFFELETIEKLMVILEMAERLEAYMLTLLANLNRDIVLSVRENLPMILEERAETTFGLQMVRLNKALTGSQGKKLARYIRHHYPVALIDESQDINGEQAIMIESIYLSKDSSKKNNSNHEFLLLVGDPKQAIYGFRGGDVANYNYMKSQFDKEHIWTLDINRRSNQSLINGLNHWFGMPTSDTANNRLSQLGEGIYYQHIKAHNSKNELSWFNPEVDADCFLIKEVLSNHPVSLLHLPKDKDLTYDEYETTARHIAAVLHSGHTLQGRPIKPSDIGVLARTKKDLKRVEDELVKLDIPTLTTSDVSIFETVMAEDVAALLNAMLYPYRHDMINRVLTSHLYGLSLQEVQAMMTDHNSEASTVGSSQQTRVMENGPQNHRGHNYQDFISFIKQGAQYWQDYGILSALHYLFDKSAIQPNGGWQALATLPEGERHIMDLRHVTDILAQYGVGMGEHELLSWFKQNIEAAPNSEWAKQYPLPTDSGVQLMTIHKSKGLEFPIVYVLGMGNASKKAGKMEQYGLYLYNAQQAVTPIDGQTSGNQRRFSPVQGTATNDSYFTDIETEEDFDELRRLGYVAFTRASEQLYVVVKDPKDSRDKLLKPMFYWFESEEANFEIPQRLQDCIGMLRGAHIAEYHEQNFNSNKNALNLAEQNQTTVEAIDYPAFTKVMKQSYFFGWAKTSFTALARQLDDSAQALVIADERIDDATDIDISSMDMANDAQDGPQIQRLDALKSKEDIRFSFVRGANAGTFLHEVFEKIDFNDKSSWSAVIDRAVSGYQLPVSYASVDHQLRVLKNKNKEESDSANKDMMQEEGQQHQALQDWVEEVLYTPLKASGKALIEIPSNKRTAEMGFNMGLSETFQASKINELFQQLLPDQPDKHIQLTDKNNSSLYRYLKGEIDLVYEDAGKFYVVDYKSNHLGNSLSNYSEGDLKKAMSKAGYWLQAAIYQVALHRFLTMRIKDYVGNEHKYLGPVEYVFLRGAHYIEEGAFSANNSVNSVTKLESEQYGLVTWDIPIDLIKALDRLFGRPLH